MIALIQRVTQAKVEVNNQLVGAIDSGLLVLLGVEKQDSVEKAKRLAQRVANYRVFNDNDGKMNLSLLQTGGQALVVSQFTLVANTNRGNRPSFSSAAGHQLSNELYQIFCHEISNQGILCATGQFAADMQVSLQNDGPVTFQLKI